MDEDTRELVRGLFVAITAMIEDAHEVSVEGQSPSLDRQAAQRVSAALVRSARGLETLAQSISVIIARTTATNHWLLLTPAVPGFGSTGPPLGRSLAGGWVVAEIMT